MSPTDPNINVRARTQIVIDGITRYMGEQFQMPKRQALGCMLTSELEEVIDPVRPLTWMASAPGPMEQWQLPFDFANQGSREGAIGNNRGGTPGQQQTRQLSGWRVATNLLPQQYDDYRNQTTAGLQGPTDQQWQKGATGATSGAQPQPFPPTPPGALALGGALLPASPRHRRQEGREHRREERRDMREGRRDMRDMGRYGREQRGEARHERRSDRYDQRHAEAHHERRSDRYDQRHERSPEAHHERREDRYDRRHERSRSRSREEGGRRRRSAR